MEFSVWVGGGAAILMCSLLQIGRSCGERADPPHAAVSRFYVLGRPLPHIESKSGMGKIHREAQNFAVTCRVQACILWITVLTQKLKSVVVFL